MSESYSHPDPDLLDRLRAGLLDDTPEVQRELEEHISTCNTCRQKVQGWEQVGELLRNEDTKSGGLEERLQAARQRAMQQDRSTGFGFGGARTAIAAGLVLAVSLSLWQLWDTQLVEQEQYARQNQQAPAVYEDLDFYIWLAGNEETALPDPIFMTNKS